MSFEVRFKTVDGPMERDALSAWLMQRGEPAADHEEGLALKALPVTFSSHDGWLWAALDITAACPLARLVDMLFDLSIELGADVELADRGEISRPRLWLLLADEQDRVRLASALVRSREHSNSIEVLRRLWSMIDSVRDGHDDRWDAAQERIVEVIEVGGPSGLSLSDARRMSGEAEIGEEVVVPVEGHLHTLAWRWFSESYPGVAESQHTMH